MIQESPPTSTPPVTSSEANAPKQTSPPKPKKKKHVQKKKAHKQKAKPAHAPAKGATLGVQVKKTVAVATVASGDSFDYETLVFLAMIGLAVACLLTAAIPAKSVPWRPAAYFVATRQIDFAIVGLALLLLAGFTFLVTGGT